MKGDFALFASMHAPYMWPNRNCFTHPTGTRPSCLRRSAAPRKRNLQAHRLIPWKRPSLAQQISDKLMPRLRFLIPPQMMAVHHNQYNIMLCTIHSINYLQLFTAHRASKWACRKKKSTSTTQLKSPNCMKVCVPIFKSIKQVRYFT